ASSKETSAPGVEVSLYWSSGRGDMTGLVERRRRWFVCCLSKRKLDGIASTRCVQVLYAKCTLNLHGRLASDQLKIAFLSQRPDLCEINQMDEESSERSRGASRAAPAVCRNRVERLKIQLQVLYMSTSPRFFTRTQDFPVRMNLLV
ncbi:hypothetical protein PC112_g24305, partial [Phytophthora cactorum]